MEFQVTTHFQIEDVVRIAIEAGNRILEVYNGKVADWDVVKKGDNSPLTMADLAANTIICNALVRLAPHVPIVSEENKQVDPSVRQKYQYWWCVDPLDGTKEFIKRNGQFTVNIALIRGQVPVLGVVHVPVTGKTYWAADGQGAHTRDASGDRRIHAAQFSLSDPGLTLVGSASHAAMEKDFAMLFKDPQFTMFGSSLKLMMVAEGSAHMYPRLAPTCEWDIAASDIIVREAGGRMLQAGRCSDKGQPLEDWKEVLAKELPVEYNKDALLNPFFLAIGKHQPSQTMQALIQGQTERTVT